MNINMNVGITAFSAALMLFSGSANAAHLEFYNDPSAMTDEKFEIFCDGGTCDPGNDGVDILASPLFAITADYTDDDGDNSTQNGGLFDIGQSSGAAVEFAFVDANKIAGDTNLSFIEKLEDGDITDDEDFTFISTARYVLIKIGGGGGPGSNKLKHGLLVNLSGDAISYRFSKVGTGGGLSHLSFYDADYDDPHVGEVPVPAAGLLMLSGLLGLGFISRRRRS